MLKNLLSTYYSLVIINLVVIRIVFRVKPKRSLISRISINLLERIILKIILKELVY